MMGMIVNNRKDIKYDTAFGHSPSSTSKEEQSVSVSSLFLQHFESLSILFWWFLLFLLLVNKLTKHENYVSSKCKQNTNTASPHSTWKINEVWHWMVVVPVQGLSPYFACFDATNAVDLVSRPPQRLIRQVITYIEAIQGPGRRISSIERQSEGPCSDGPCGGTITAFFWKFRGYCAPFTIECTITFVEVVRGVVVMIEGD